MKVCISQMLVLWIRSRRVVQNRAHGLGSDRTSCAHGHGRDPCRAHGLYRVRGLCRARDHGPGHVRDLVRGRDPCHDHHDPDETTADVARRTEKSRAATEPQICADPLRLVASRSAWSRRKWM